jgi:hypothetical protein
MSQAAVEQALGKLITDDGCRARFVMDPAGATFAAGLEFSPAEWEAPARLPAKAIARFSGCLENQIRRIPLEEKGNPTRSGVATS